jgi:hypothetical protein
MFPTAMSTLVLAVPGAAARLAVAGVTASLAGVSALAVMGTLFTTPPWLTTILSPTELPALTAMKIAEITQLVLLGNVDMQVDDAGSILRSRP